MSCTDLFSQNGDEATANVTNKTFNLIRQKKTNMKQIQTQNVTVVSSVFQDVYFVFSTCLFVFIQRSRQQNRGK